MVAGQGVNHNIGRRPEGRGFGRDLPAIGFIGKRVQFPAPEEFQVAEECDQFAIQLCAPQAEGVLGLACVGVGRVVPIGGWDVEHVFSVFPREAATAVVVGAVDRVG